jgi:hypothetical protein
VTSYVIREILLGKKSRRRPERGRCRGDICTPASFSLLNDFVRRVIHSGGPARWRLH